MQHKQGNKIHIPDNKNRINEKRPIFEEVPKSGRFFSL